MIVGHQVGLMLSTAGSTGNRILGNAIGPRNQIGILIHSASGNTLGGTNTGEANRIAFNSGYGIQVLLGTNNAIRGNAIFSNNGLGIELFQDGMTPNDPGDADTGPNQFQNFPVLLAATSDLSGLVLTGMLGSAANASFYLDFFANPACDQSYLGQGQAYLGSAIVTTDGGGDASFTLHLAAPLLGGQSLSATATDAAGNTSEFSACVPVQGLSALELAITSSNNVHTLAWPSASFGWELEQTENLWPPIIWQPVPGVIEDNGMFRFYVVTNGLSVTNRFYRLRKSQ